MTIFFDERWVGDHGIGRFAREVRTRVAGFEDLGLAGSPTSPIDPLRMSVRALRLRSDSLIFSPGYNPAPWFGDKYIFTIHDLNHIDFPAARSLSKTIYYRTLLQPGAHVAAAVLTVSDYSKQRIARWSGIDPEKIFNVGNGVDGVFSHTGQHYQHCRPYFLCVGNRKAHKNETRTLKAFAKISTRHECDLLFNGSASPELTHLIATEGLRGRVHFLGGLTDAELAAAYRGATALVFASLYEGFGLPVIEANACGTPVITSRVCSLPEVAGDAALLVDPCDVDAIASALERILVEPELTMLLRSSGLFNARRFSWDATAEKVGAVLAQVAATQACRRVGSGRTS